MDALARSSATQDAPGTVQQQTPLHVLLAVAWRLLALLAAVAVSIAGLVVLIPDGNDYSYGTVLKHKRLEQIKTPKIVLVGGSNLSYGIDSKMIQRATGCPVVNMGMNGYFGVRYMLEEVKPEIRRGDIVVIAFEYDNLYKSVDGSPRDLLAIIKVNPSAFGYLTLKQKLDVLGAAPNIAQNKIMRLLGEAIVAVKRRVIGKNYDNKGPVDMDAVESLGSFTAEGDIVGHLGLVWPYFREDAVAPKGATIDRDMVPLMRSFAEEMQKRGASVIVSYTPVIREVYKRLESDLVRYSDMIGRSAPLVAPSPPSSFAYDKSLFFDTVYHLNERGRPLRTQRLIDDLQSALRERARCS